MRKLKPQPLAWSIVAADKFVKATRDSGYSSTASAISELVDNSIQAGADRIYVQILQDSAGEISIDVRDNGSGMDMFTLRQALRFGGSSRFNDRSGLGRFGMGLPNSSLSQARKVIVTSWSNARQSGQSRENVVGHGIPHQTYLDIDEVATGEIVEVPKPKAPSGPSPRVTGRSGTIVQWRNCDRLDRKRATTIARHTAHELAQRFRFFLSEGVKIFINETPIQPLDPLFVLGRPIRDRSRPYGQEILYTIAADPEDSSAGTGVVRVRFVELPVAKWAALSNSEKRQRGIVNNAGASIVRCRREVDYGWFFFGKKRKENYDDWWRCEIQFEPILDEAFGLTHTKQQIRPKQYLLDILVPDLEQIARTLNARARAAHGDWKCETAPRRSEVIAGKKSRFLGPVCAHSEKKRDYGTYNYRIEESHLKDDCFFSHRIDGNTLILTLDPDHAFYREVYQPLRDSCDAGSAHLKTLIELLVLAAARAEACAPDDDARIIADYRSRWSTTAETFIGG